jgi:hypothetical protein
MKEFKILSEFYHNRELKHNENNRILYNKKFRLITVILNIKNNFKMCASKTQEKK